MLVLLLSPEAARSHLRALDRQITQRSHAVVEEVALGELGVLAMPMALAEEQAERYTRW